MCHDRHWHIKKKDHTTRRFLPSYLTRHPRPPFVGAERTMQNNSLSEKGVYFLFIQRQKKSLVSFRYLRLFRCRWIGRAEEENPLSPLALYCIHHVKIIIIERKICSTVWIQNRRQIFFLSIPNKPEISFLFCVTWHV